MMKKLAEVSKNKLKSVKMIFFSFFFLFFFFLNQNKNCFSKKKINKNNECKQKIHIVALYSLLKVAISRTNQREGPIYFVTNNRIPHPELQKSLNHFASFLASFKMINFHFPTDNLDENLLEIQNKLRSSLRSLSLDHLTLEPENYQKYASKLASLPFIYFNFIDYLDTKESNIFDDRIILGQDIGYYKAIHPSSNYIKVFLINTTKEIWKFCFVFSETHFSEQSMREISEEFIDSLKKFAYSSSNL